MSPEPESAASLNFLFWRKHGWRIKVAKQLGFLRAQSHNVTNQAE